VTRQVLKQCRLAYARFPVYHQYPALTGTNGLRELVKDVALGVAAGQLCCAPPYR
jgi:hypothetical protein